MKINLVIGSGPTGLVTSKFLLHKNQKVIMVDGTSSKKFKQDEFKINLSQKSSPKYNSSKFVTSNKLFRKKNLITSKNFFLTSSIIRGGLTNFWGGGLEYPSHNYLEENKVNIRDYKKNLKLAENFLQINSFEEKKIKEIMSKKFKYFKSLFKHKKNNIHELVASRSSNEFHKNLPSGKNFNFLINKLKRKKMIIKDNKFVKEIKKNNNKFKVFFDDNTNLVVDRIFCCAGTVGSTILVSKLIKIYNKKIRLYHNPMYQLLFFTISKTKKILKSVSLPYTKVIFKYKNTENSGSLVLLNDLSERTFDNFFLRKIYNLIKNFLIGGNFFISQNFSKTYIKLKKNSIVSIVSSKSELEEKIIKKLNNYFIKNNFYPIPFISGKKYLNGSDTHYTSTLHNLKLGKKLIINKQGELRKFKNFFILDGSVIPPGLNYPTLFIICNALMKLNKIFDNEK